MEARIVAITVVVSLLLAGCAGSGDATSSGDPPAVTDQTGCIRALVVDDAIRPIAGARVTLAKPERTALTDDGGRADLCGLTPGAYLTSANRTGHAAGQALVQVQAGAAQDVRFTLTILRTSRAYHETVPLHGYTDASAGVVTPVLDPTLRSAGVACTCSFVVAPSQAPAAIVLEADWTDTLANPVTPTKFVWQVAPEGSNGTASGQMAAPLLKHLSRIDFGDPAFSFDKAPSYRVSLFPDATWPAVSQGYDIYVTFWYLERPPSTWSFLNGDK